VFLLRGSKSCLRHLCRGGRAALGDPPRTYRHGVLHGRNRRQQDLRRHPLRERSLPPVLVIVRRPAMLDSVEQRRAAMRQMRRSGGSFFRLSFCFLRLGSGRRVRHADSKSTDLRVGVARLRAAGQRSRPVAKHGAALAVEQGCLLAQARAARTARKGGPRIHKRGALHDAWRQTPVDVARDGTAIMIHGNEGRAVSCGGGLGCLASSLSWGQQLCREGEGSG
jgi:hypothetical protein